MDWAFVHYRGMQMSHKIGRRRVASALGAIDRDDQQTVALRPLVVVPTYNERENLDAIVRGIRQYLPQAEILVIDDGSPDGTGDIAESLSSSLGRIQVMHRPGKMGLGTAYVTGFR